MRTFIQKIKTAIGVVSMIALSQFSSAQCVTPVMTSISNTGPACVGGTITLKASGTVGGVSSGYVRMAGIGGNQGNRETNRVFAEDRPGSIARISNATFDAIFAGQPNDAARAAAIKAQYDVLLFTWASPSDANLSWGLIDAYLSLGGSVFWEDNGNISRLSPGIVGQNAGTTFGCNYQLVNPAPFPILVSNGVSGCFDNDHLRVSSWPSWMKVYIKANGYNLAIAGIHPTGGGRLIVQGPDQDYHAYKYGDATDRNQYQILLNQIDFLTAEQTGISWTGPNGFSSNEANPILTNVTAAQAGVYTAKLTNVTGGGCFTTATTTVVVNSGAIPTVTTSGTTNLCPGNSVTLTSSPGAQYSWSNGATTQSITVSAAGNYTVTVVETGATCPGTSAPVEVKVNAAYCNQPPVIVCAPVTIAADANCQANANTFVSVSDPDGDAVTITSSHAGPFALGVTPVTLTANDGKGGIATCTSSVTVIDQTAPLTPVLADVTGECSATAPVATTTDNCTGNITGSTNDPLTYTTQGVHVINWKFVDASGNETTATQKVVIADVTAPSIAAPASITVGACNAINLGTPVSSDNCGVASVTNDAPANYPVGTTTVNWTVTDIAGNQSSASQTVTVMAAPTVAVSVSRTNTTYTALGANVIALGYGAQTLTLTATGTGTGINYSWNTGATTASINVSPVATTVYSVTVTDQFGCSATTSFTVEVIDARCGNKVLVCQKTNSATNPSVQICVAASSVPAHLAKGSTLGSCGNQSFMVTTNTRKNASPETEALVMAYPNPARGIFNLELHGFRQGKVQIAITDANGKIVMSKQTVVSYNTEDISIDMSTYANGVYNIKVTGANGIKNTRVVISR